MRATAAEKLSRAERQERVSRPVAEEALGVQTQAGPANTVARFRQ